MAAAIITKILFHRVVLILIGVILIGGAVFGYWNIHLLSNTNTLNIKVASFNSEINSLREQLASTAAKLSTTETELNDLKNQDQVKINQELNDEVKNINNTYKKAVSTYESLLDLKPVHKGTEKMDNLYAESLTLLSNRKYSDATTKLSELEKQIQTERDKIAQSAAPKPAANVETSNTPPAAGQYSRQNVSVDGQTFLVDIVSADLNSTRVIVDTASDGDCRDNCPVLSLSEYVSRSGAYAGINGSYFCPASYPSCVGKTNSFDTLLMNKNKTYFNSENNVYSTVPAVIFSGSSARFVAQSLEWGRDTSVDAVIANYPLLVHNNSVVFGSSGDQKQSGKGSRSFVGATGSTAYIGVVHNATVAEVAKVVHAMGIHNAINLDSGGSTALWSGGYKVGPGRNIPDALLFVRK